VGLVAPIQCGGKVQGVLGISVVARSDLDQDLRFLGEVAGVLADRLGRMHKQARAPLAPHSDAPLLKNIGEGVCVLDSDLCIVSANPALEHITGWRESELLGRKYDEIFAPQVDQQQLDPGQTLPGRALRAQGAIAPTQHTIAHQDGRRIPVEGMAVWLKGVDDAPAGVITTMRDLTPEIELGQLRHALKTLAAHSLRAQLTAINSLAEILRQGSLPDDARDEILEALQAQNVQLEKLTQEMLSAPQPRATTMPLRHHPVTLKPIIEQVVKYFQAATVNSSLRVVLTPDLPFVIGDENKIELALANIIDNALMPDNLQTLVISAGTSDDHVVVAVERELKAGSPPVNGKANLAENHRLESLGTELNTARKLILAQGGQVWTENQPGMKTRFCFSLPKMEVGDDAQAFVD
jgi:PAS domain S-box-containing protein